MSDARGRVGARRLAALLILACSASRPHSTDTMSEPHEAVDRPASRSQDYPWMSDDSWLGRHRTLVLLDPERKRRSKLVFLGDSIVEGWVDASWDESFGVYDAVRLGMHPSLHR